jgi:hypothetical protein
MFDRSESWPTGQQVRRVACGLGLALGAVLPVPLPTMSAEGEIASASPPVVEVTPPAPLNLFERVPPAPGSKYVWLPGEWAWRGRGYVWIPGRYMRPREPNSIWTPGHWALAPEGHPTWVEGHWNPHWR